MHRFLLKIVLAGVLGMHAATVAAEDAKKSNGEKIVDGAKKLCEGKFFGGLVDLGTTDLIAPEACECVKNISEVIGNPLDIVNAISDIKNLVKTWDTLKGLKDFGKAIQEFEKLMTTVESDSGAAISKIKEGSLSSVLTGSGDLCKSGFTGLKAVVGALNNFQAILISSKDGEGYTQGTINYQQHENRLAQVAQNKHSAEKLIARLEAICAAIGCVGRIVKMGVEVYNVAHDPLLRDQSTSDIYNLARQDMSIVGAAATTAGLELFRIDQNAADGLDKVLPSTNSVGGKLPPTYEAFKTVINDSSNATGTASAWNAGDGRSFARAEACNVTSVIYSRTENGRSRFCNAPRTGFNGTAQNYCHSKCQSTTSGPNTCVQGCYDEFHAFCVGAWSCP